MEQILRGDVVWFAPEEKHWHGAIPTTAMTHIAVQEKAVLWMASDLGGFVTGAATVIDGGWSL